MDKDELDRLLAARTLPKTSAALVFTPLDDGRIDVKVIAPPGVNLISDAETLPPQVLVALRAYAEIMEDENDDIPVMHKLRETLRRIDSGEADLVAMTFAICTAVTGTTAAHFECEGTIIDDLDQDQNAKVVAHLRKLSDEVFQKMLLVGSLPSTPDPENVQ